ncbi:MAG: efflux RND transporter periplasmic adaptor subunit [bacterium]
MKRNIRILIIILAVAIPLAGFVIFETASSSKAQADREITELYTCAMHPEVIQKGPGLCPICHMELVPLGSIENLSDDGTGSAISIPSEMIQKIGVKYATVELAPLEKTINAAAHVDYDEDNYNALSIRADGWIEKLYVTSPGETVNKGESLFEFYSPKLYSAQEEYLIARRAGDTRLVNAARERLILLGISDSQIGEIPRNGVKRTLTITSPIDGVVVEIGSSSGGGGASMSASQSGSSGGMSDMNSGGGGISSGSSGSMNGGGSIKEGNFVGSGTQVFAVADLSNVWVYAHVYEDELPFVHEGMDAELELDYLPGQVFKGTVDRIYPFLDRMTRDIKLRLVFSNPDRKLLPGMFGKVRMTSRISDNALIIPEEALIFGGNGTIVFLALDEGRFKPQEVEVGPSDGNGHVQIVSGLENGQRVVTSAQFLLDSESKLREAVNKMIAGAHQSHNISQTPLVEDSHIETTPAPASSETESDWPNLAPDDPDARFRCPMPDDRYYSAEDGDCPICGMHLEPYQPETDLQRAEK